MKKVNLESIEVRGVPKEFDNKILIKYDLLDIELSERDVEYIIEKTKEICNFIYDGGIVFNVVKKEV